MPTDWREMIWGQFGASIDMLENAVLACPEGVWSASSEKPRWKERDVAGFWYVVYHTLFWLDRYLTNPPTDFIPRAPFTLDELDPAGILPERVYSKDEMLQYLQECREKCHDTIMSLNDEDVREPCGLDWLPVTRAELLLYNLRHVQHHVGQLNLLLRQGTGSAPRYVMRAEE
ncbi:DinB family protein [Alicyclobacillus dauci]|uniref:DinB family protein n=1 Tax=Alicyclobacillus dauci TaxID=1475485 RepID=A0ABY6Z1A2_9BACL|nr:DinB family protein [Alicyclobacillus dauci]WAH36104.1 DinB family protein [Alicyclobacillus dauci]